MKTLKTLLGILFFSAVMLINSPVMAQVDSTNTSTTTMTHHDRKDNDFDYGWLGLIGLLGLLGLTKKQVERRVYNTTEETPRNR